MTMVSLVVPCYNEEESIPAYYATVKKLFDNGLAHHKLEIIFVDDGSKDRTLEVIKKYAHEDKRVKYISFSRNFGKESAIYAGLEHAKGEYIAVMDVDLQDPPCLLTEMLDCVERNEADIVGTRRVTRKGEPPVRSFFARLFYKSINNMSDIPIVDGARDYRLMTRKVVDAILEVKEYNRFSKGIFSWVGFKTKWLEYENIERIAGETKWSFFKLLIYAVDGMVAFSTRPLIISAVVGILLSLIAVASLIFIMLRRLLCGDPVAGWASTVSFILFTGGLQMLFVGIVGIYLSKTYLETKKRPIYILAEDNISDNSETLL